MFPQFFPVSAGEQGLIGRYLAAARSSYSGPARVTTSEKLPDAASSHLAPAAAVAAPPEVASAEKLAVEEVQVPPKGSLDLPCTESVAVESAVEAVDEPIVSTEDFSTAVIEPKVVPTSVPPPEKFDEHEPVVVSVSDTTGTEEDRGVGATVAAVEASVDDSADTPPTDDVTPDEKRVHVDGAEGGKAVEQFEDYVTVQPNVDVVPPEARKAGEKPAAVKPVYEDRSLAAVKRMVLQASVKNLDDTPVGAATDESSPGAQSSGVEGTVFRLTWRFSPRKDVPARRWTYQRSTAE